MLSKGQKIQYTKGAATFKNAYNDALKNTHSYVTLAMN